MRRGIVLGVLIAVGALSLVVRAYQAPPPQGPKVIDVEKVKDNLFVLRGGGGNTAVFVTANGVVVVDAKNPGWGQVILDKIKTLTDKPVTMLINTHTHGDHVSGGVEFPATVDRVVQENTKANMERMDLFKGDNAKFLPTKTFKDKMTLGSGNDRIDLYYFGPGHTGGDAWVVFPALRTMHAADMFPDKVIPIMDSAVWQNNGGSAVQYPQTLKKAIAGIKDVDTIISGHSAKQWAPADLQEFQQFIQDFVDWGTAQQKAGKSADEAIAAYQLPAKYAAAGYKFDPARLKQDVQTLYSELKK
jgi:cyclase